MYAIRSYYGIIYRSTAEALGTYGSRRDPARLVHHGETLRQPELADALEALAREGDALFYRGELAQRLASACATGGGHLTLDDLRSYRVVKREPRITSYNVCYTKLLRPEIFLTNRIHIHQVEAKYSPDMPGYLISHTFISAQFTDSRIVKCS